MARRAPTSTSRATPGGSPRSVGGANGANPIPIIIPCHRVVATTGIGGYSGGEGLPTKRSLLRLEAPAGGSARDLGHSTGDPDLNRDGD